MLVLAPFFKACKVHTSLREYGNLSQDIGTLIHVEPLSDLLLILISNHVEVAVAYLPAGLDQEVIELHLFVKLQNRVFLKDADDHTVDFRPGSDHLYDLEAPFAVGRAKNVILSIPHESLHPLEFLIVLHQCHDSYGRVIDEHLVLEELQVL